MTPEEEARYRALAKASLYAQDERLVAEEVNFIPITPHPKQKLFLDLDNVKEALFGGGVGGGKTISLLADALKYAHVKDYSALLLRVAYPDLKQEGGLIDVAHKWLQPFVKSGAAHWSEQDHTWTFKGGGTLRFGYLATENDKYRYQGGEYQYIGFDEVTQFRESQYQYLFSRLRKKESLDVPLRIRGATNPGGIGGQWVYDRFIPEDFTPERAGELRIWEKEHEDGHKTAFVPSLLVDNPSLDQQSYRESLSQLDEITRQQYLTGDWLIQIRGDILYTYSEAHSVITWEQFAEIFGQGSIPNHWQCSVYQDFGTTEAHPCVTTWFATAGKNAPVINGVPMADKVFVYRGMMATRATAADVAEQIKHIMTKTGEIARCERWQMSHEASSERMEYIQQDLPFANWPTGRTRGVEQLKNALQVKYTDKQHPFKRTLMGCPSMFLIVDKNELLNPKTDAGLARWRAEIIAYHWNQLKSGEVMTRLEPYPLFNDAVDTLRAAAADYFPESASLTREEAIQKHMPAHLIDDKRPYRPENDLEVHFARKEAQKKAKAEYEDIVAFDLYD